MLRTPQRFIPPTDGTGKHTFQAGAKGAITFIIPYDNGRATISYTDITTVTEDNEIYLTKLNCTIKIGEIAEGTLAFDMSNTGITYKATLGSYEYNSSIAFLGNETATESATIKKIGVTIISVNTSNTETKEGYDVISNLTIGGLEAKIKVKATKTQLENPNTDLKDIYTVEIYTTAGKKVGGMSFEGNKTNVEGYFAFNDGIRIKAATLMPEMYSFIFDFIQDLV